MVVKKVLYNSGAERIAVCRDSQWKLLKPKLDFLEFLRQTSESESLDLEEFEPNEFSDLIPLRPTAYRDFMLYEKHVVEAGRGYVKKYLPKLLPIVNGYEKVFGKPFPMLKPKARYYEHPIYYMGNHLNFVTNGDKVAIPSYTNELDYELELVAIISKPLKNAKEVDVIDAIAGFAILNDFSARDVQKSEMESGFGPMKTKNFANGISAAVAPKSSLIDRLDSLKVKVVINDKLIATGNTSGARYSLIEAIVYASWEEQLHPGELFGSGTIPGCSGLENGVMLSPQDIITLEVEGIGQLRNEIVQ